MSADLLTPGSRTGAETTDRPKKRGESAAARRALGAAGLLCVVAGVVLLNPVLVLSGLAVTTTGLLMRWISWDLALPAAVITMLALSTLVGVAAGLLGIDLLASPWTVASVYVAYAGAGAFWAWRPAGAALTRAAPAGGYTWAAYVTAAIAGALGLAQSFFERMPASWAFSGTDLAQHMITVVDLQRSGSLDYSISSYPRAFHMLAALVSVPGAPLTHPAALLSYDMRLVAAATWLSLAVVLWSGGTLALRLGAVHGVRRPVTIGAAALFGSVVLLTNSFILSFVNMGAAASLLAVAVILALPLAALGLKRHRHRVIALSILTAVSVMLLAHLWQTLLVVPLLGFAAYAGPRLRDVAAFARRRSWRTSGRSGVLVLVTCSVMLAVGSVPLLSVQAAGGIGLAGQAGTLADVPWVVLIGGLLVAAWLLRDVRRGSTRIYLGSVAGLLLAAAVMLRGADKGFDLHQYYPMKVLWFLTIVLSPVLSLAAVGLGSRLLGPLWRLLGRFGASARVCRSALVALLGALALAFWVPTLLGTGPPPWASLDAHSSSHDDSSAGGVSAERFDIATDYGTRFSPAVTVPVEVGHVTLFDHYGPYVISKLISFQTGQPQTNGQAAGVCADVALATGGSGNAVVITQLKPTVLRAIMTKHGCGEVPVVKIPGGAEELPHL